MEDAYARSVSEVLEAFGVDASKGLSDSQVAEHARIYGKNVLPQEESTPFWKLVLKQFDDLLVKILIAAAVISFVLAIIDGETGLGAFLEPSVILLILAANAAVGVITETNAEKALEELKAYQADVATVLRNGLLSIIPASDLVPGDIVEVGVGCKVPADMRVIEMPGGQLRVDQAILTGESCSVVKEVEVPCTTRAVYQDKTNILFSGTIVASGRAKAVVVGVGSNTAMGSIRDAMLRTEDEMTPLKKKLDEFGSFLAKVIAVICVLVWVVNIGHFHDPAHGGILRGAIHYFKIAVALAVAAIPEGLPAVVTTCLALGTKRMARLNAIVRSLPSVETLGCTTVICSDKTGTLTTNMMSVSKICVICSVHHGPVSTEYTVTGTTYAPDGVVYDSAGLQLEYPAHLPCLLHIAMCSALCNDSTLQYNPDKGTYEKIGESTEVALRVLAEKVGLPGFDSMPSALNMLSKHERASYCNHYWENQFRKVAVLEFSRDRKMMSVLCSRKQQEIMFSKGAPESIIARCTNVLCNDDGSAVPLTADIRSELEERFHSFGQKEMLRCLALALKRIPSGQQSLSFEDESGLTFIGLVGMLDPPREEVKNAIQTCMAAGIRVIVVTGDNKSTAESLCRRIGAFDPLDDLSGRSYTASEFEELSPVQRAIALQQLVLFSRVEPAHKRMLVEALQHQNEVVAMTGDGVNDAPALKKADIGIAMGSGTAVAKGASDMVLTDDNFASIVAAVAEGRAIYSNTKQFIRYMISSNIGEVVCIFVAAVLGMPETLVPVQLLWVNLVTDGLPATAIGFNKQDRKVMLVKPRKVNEAIVNGWLFFRFLVIGAYVGLATIAGFAWWFLYYEGGPKLSYKELVITNATLVCRHGRKLMESHYKHYKHIYRTPCGVHALKDNEKITWVKNMVAEARDLQMFIYNLHTSLALFRFFSNKEFIKSAETRYATYFLLLERMLEVEHALQSMVVTQEWRKWPESHTEEGKRLRDKVLDNHWWDNIRYLVSFINPVHAVIRYADTDSPNLGEIYETFDSMLEEMKRIIYAKDPSFYDQQIKPIIVKRWDKMNTPLHMAAHALNPKWYVPRENKKTPNNDQEVKDGFMKFISKVYTSGESAIIRAEFMQFVRLRGRRFSTPECREDRATLAQIDPIGWWDLYGDDAPHLKQLAIKLLSQVGSSSAAERNWSTYGFIHSMRRNRLSPKRAEKLVAVHSYLRLRERVKPEYKASPAARWDFDPVEAANLEVDDDVQGLVGLPLENAHLDDDESNSSDSLAGEEDDIDYNQDILVAHEPLEP